MRQATNSYSLHLLHAINYKQCLPVLTVFSIITIIIILTTKPLFFITDQQKWMDKTFEYVAYTEK